MSATATQTVKFRSDHRGLRVVRRSQIDQLTAMGTMAMVQPEVVYEFQLGWREVEPGTDILPDGPYDDATGQPALQDAVTWLRAFSAKNGLFHEVVEVAPDPSPLIVEILDAQAAGDIELLQHIGTVEHESWNRREVMDRVVAALDSLEPTAVEPDPPKRKT